MHCIVKNQCFPLVKTGKLENVARVILKRGSVLYSVSAIKPGLVIYEKNFINSMYVVNSRELVITNNKLLLTDCSNEFNSREHL